jgi:cytochrome c-type biogenesis protein CcmF
MMVLGVVATSAYQQEKVLAMKPGERTTISGYTLAFTGTHPVRGPNYAEEVGTLDVTRGGRNVTTLYPAKRLYDQPKQPTTEAGIHNALGGDLYVVLGDRQTDGGYTMRLYFNPLVRLIWLGAVVMFIGGGLSLSDRRLRVGAPKRAKVRGAVQAAE